MQEFSSAVRYVLVLNFIQIPGVHNIHLLPLIISLLLLKQVDIHEKIIIHYVVIYFVIAV